MRSDTGQGRVTTEGILDLIVNRPTTIVLLFFLLTALFGIGLLLVEVETGFDDFTAGTPEQDVLDTTEERFGGSFDPESEQTILIHQGDNVLDRTELIRMLTVQETLSDRDAYRVSVTESPARMIAHEIDPEATSIVAERRTIEAATSTEIRDAVRNLATDPLFLKLLSDDFNPESVTASATLGTVTHDFPAGSDTAAEFEKIQPEMRMTVDRMDGDIRVFGQGIIDAELRSIIFDSMQIVMPAVVLLILLLLLVFYRDPLDLVLGLSALLMALVWTFGFVGYIGIPFDDSLIPVPVLLLAIGIDFGIHVINRFREERTPISSLRTAMETAMRQLFGAFLIVAIVTAIGFGANITSPFEPTQDFGIAASVGMFFTLLIFGIYLPAAKISLDELTESSSIPRFEGRALGAPDSFLGRFLPKTVDLSATAPLLFLTLVVFATVGAGVYATDVDREFSEDDFLPPEELPWYIDLVPDPLGPTEYTSTRDSNVIDARFDSSPDDTVLLMLEGPFGADYTLESIARSETAPPSVFVTDGRTAQSTGIWTVLAEYGTRSPEFASQLDASDSSGTGLPDSNLGAIYADLFASEYGSNAADYLTQDRRYMLIEYRVESDASDTEIATASEAFSDQFRFSATPTGETIVFAAVAETIFRSALRSLGVAILLGGVFLILVYWTLERKPVVGLVTIFPILIVVTWLVATIRALGLSLNAMTAMILSISVGIGVAYSVHISHRFIDEYRQDPDPRSAVTKTLQGTGGALTGSMITTAVGASALLLAITPALKGFGIIMTIAVIYSYLGAILLVPPALLLWTKFSLVSDSIG